MKFVTWRCDGSRVFVWINTSLKVIRNGKKIEECEKWLLHLASFWPYHCAVCIAAKYWSVTNRSNSIQDMHHWRVFLKIRNISPNMSLKQWKKWRIGWNISKFLGRLSSGAYHEYCRIFLEPLVCWWSTRKKVVKLLVQTNCLVFSVSHNISPSKTPIFEQNIVSRFNWMWFEIYLFHGRLFTFLRFFNAFLGSINFFFVIFGPCCLFLFLLLKEKQRHERDVVKAILNYITFNWSWKMLQWELSQVPKMLMKSEDLIIAPNPRNG